MKSTLSVLALLAGSLVALPALAAPTYLYNFSFTYANSSGRHIDGSFTASDFDASGYLHGMADGAATFYDWNGSSFVAKNFDGPLIFAKYTFAGWQSGEAEVSADPTKNNFILVDCTSFNASGACTSSFDNFLLFRQVSNFSSDEIVYSYAPTQGVGQSDRGPTLEGVWSLRQVALVNTVPEPGSLALLAAAGLALGLRRKARR